MPEGVRRQLEETPSEHGGRLGRHINHDPRSRAYRVHADPGVELLDVHHQPHIPTLDQGNLGSCVPNGGTTVLSTEEFWWTLSEKDRAQLGEPYAVDLYREVTRADPYPGEWEPTDTGTDGLSLAKVLQRRGTIAGFLNAFDPAAALATLQKQALITGIAWKSGCDRPNSDGLVSWSGSVRGGHELAVTGYRADRQWIELRNSWGPSWGVPSHFSGEGGYFYMTVADWALALADNGDVTVFVPLTQPAPVPVSDGADRHLVIEMDPWANSKTVWSRFTKAGRARAGYVAWKTSKNL